MVPRGQAEKVAALVVLGWLVGGRPVAAVSLDKDGDIKVGVRTYVNARVGTEETRDGIPQRGLGQGEIVKTSGTFPHSAAGHLRQNRFFAEVEFNHKLNRLLKEGVGPLSLLNELPFHIRDLGYNLTLRAEGDGLYDWGPREYSTAEETGKILRLRPVTNQTEPDIAAIRRTLRSRAVHRERLFQAYVEGEAGNFFVRFGRQVLSWGETDAFQLLDRINPLDASFGGFLIDLDERRVPLDMLRMQYRWGDIGPLAETFLEAYVAIDDRVGFEPAIPPGSPWSLPAFGAGSTLTHTTFYTPSRTVDDARGGARLVFNWSDATFSLAYLNTYFDIPAAQLFTLGNPPLNSFNYGLPCPNPNRPDQGNDPNRPARCGSPVRVDLYAPRVQVFGATTSFAAPALYSVVRSEIAYFKDEPAFTQAQFDPFKFGALKTPEGYLTGGRRQRDSINMVLGLDTNAFIRPLNPNQSFFFSTQLFYKHIKNAAGSRLYNPDGTLNADREILPVIETLQPQPGLLSQLGPIEPIFARQPRDSFLQTLLIGTSYFGGKVNPNLVFFYDWGGAFVYQPGVTLARDPFRFRIDYSILDAHMLKGGSGVSLLKDRDNIQFRFEYVI
jgi:hypothetical protein